MLRRFLGSRLMRGLFWLAVLFFVAPGVALSVYGLHDSFERCDLLVVPANKVELDGQPSPQLLSRLEKARSLFAAKVAGTIFVSGGTGVEGWDEARVMQRYLVQHGVPAAAISVDSAGNDSFATAVHAAQYLRAHNMASALVVSNYFHILRMRQALKRCGVDTIFHAHAEYFSIRDFWSIPREVVGNLYYGLRSYPQRLSPGRR